MQMAHESWVKIWGTPELGGDLPGEGRFQIAGGNTVMSAPRFGNTE